MEGVLVSWWVRESVEGEETIKNHPKVVFYMTYKQCVVCVSTSFKKCKFFQNQALDWWRWGDSNPV